MAEYRVLAEGSRSTTSRLGHKNTGAAVTVQTARSGQLSIDVHHQEKTGRDIFTLAAGSHWGNGPDYTVVFKGDMSELLMAAKQIEKREAEEAELAEHYHQDR